MQQASRSRERTRHCEPRNVGRGKGRISAIHRAAAPLLSLPKSTIPAAVGLDRTVRDYARLLLLFWEEGIKPKKAGPVLAMANDVMGQWLAPHVKGITAVTEWSIQVGTYDEYTFDDGAPSGGLRLGIELSDARGRFMENRLGKLETETKGLGEAVIYWLEQAGCLTIDVLTPQSARYFAEYVWWRGETDEKEWREALLEEGHAPEDIEDLIGPSKFEASFPSWALRPTKPDLSALNPTTEDGKQVLGILRQMEGLDGDGGLFPWRFPESFDRVYWGAYLFWRAEQCPVTRLLDDHFEMANQGGDYLTPLNGVEVIPLEADAFKQWKLRMEKGFRMLTLLDQLILLTTEEW